MLDSTQPWVCCVPHSARFSHPCHIRHIAVRFQVRATFGTEVKICWPKIATFGTLSLFDTPVAVPHSARVSTNPAVPHSAHNIPVTSTCHIDTMGYPECHIRHCINFIVFCHVVDKTWIQDHGTYRLRRGKCHYLSQILPNDVHAPSVNLSFLP